MKKQKPFWLIDNQLSKAQLEVIQKTRLFVATPAYGGLTTIPYTRSLNSLTNLSAQVGLPLNTMFLGNESLVQRARNLCVAQFLETDATHLMFIDADVGFNAKDVLTMILAQKEIIGGNYTKKNINWKRAVEASNNGVPDGSLLHCAGDFVVRLAKKGESLEVFKPAEVKYLGTVFMLVERSVFDRMKPHVKSYIQNSIAAAKGRRDYAFFDCDVVNDEYLSEDYWFCHKALELGMKMYMAPWVHLTHSGTIEYTGCWPCTNGTVIHDLGQGKKK